MKRNSHTQIDHALAEHTRTVRKAKSHVMFVNVSRYAEPFAFALLFVAMVAILMVKNIASTEEQIQRHETKMEEAKARNAANDKKYQELVDKINNR